jgi:hypothetical protein
MMDTVAHATIQRSDEASGADGTRQTFGEIRVDAAVSKQRGPEDDVRSAHLENLLRAFERANAAANPAGEPPTYGPDERVVVASRLCPIKIDELHRAKATETIDPRVDLARFNRQRFTLDELHDASALEID